jgi:hypothetical protein
MTLVHREDLIAALLDMARQAREKTVAKFADVRCDAATRKRLDHDLECALAQFDAVIEKKIMRLRGDRRKRLTPPSH